MAPKSKLEIAQNEAAADAKQRKLSFGLGLTGGKLPATLSSDKPGGAAPSAAPAKKTTAQKPRPLAVDPDELEVRAWLNGRVQQLVKEFEDRSTNAIDIECRNVLNDMIDRLEFNPPTQGTFDSLKTKRTHYDPKVKAEVVALVEQEMVTSGSSKAEAVKKLQKVPGFDKVTSTMTRRWATSGPSKKMGRPVNEQFEEQVLAQLVYTSMEKVDDVERAVVQANVAYGQAVIERAARIVQKMPEFQNDKKVQKLQFSRKWIAGWLGRAALRRRRVTAAEKQLPSVGSVRAEMEAIQRIIDDGEFTLDEVISADETGIFFGAPPKNQYVPESAARATAPNADDKSRFTSLLWGTAQGKMGPSFNIIKMSVKGIDLSSSTVLNNLMKMPGFGEADGWEKRIWRRSLTLTVRNKTVTGEHVRPYLYHKESMTVITVQLKAWMDSAGICMWADTQLGPYFKKYGRGRCCVVWDNCGSHNVDAVAAVLKEWNITPANLPQNMTDLLQVMDLVVNGPVKAGIRRERIENLFSYFQAWKIKRLQYEAEKAKAAGAASSSAPQPPNAVALPPPFKPPKPVLADGLKTVLKVLDNSLSTVAFQSSMKKCFVEVGLAKKDDGNYVQYTAKKKGWLKHVIPQPTESEEAVSVGEIASELELRTARPEHDRDDDDPEDDQGEEEEEDGEEEGE